MFFVKMVMRVLAVAAIALVLGCAWVGNTVRSELSAYAEPAGEELAHIRLIGSRNVKVYPNSTCASLSVPGGGYPAGPQMGGQRTRDLGMPKLPVTPRHYVEIAARANEPITMAFSFQSTRVISPPNPATRSMGRSQSSSCYVTRSFVPDVGEYYEAVATDEWSSCGVGIFRLIHDEEADTWRRFPVPSVPGTACGRAAHSGRPLSVSEDAESRN